MSLPVYVRLTQGWGEALGSIEAGAQHSCGIFEGLMVALRRPEYAERLLSQMPDDVRARIGVAAMELIAAFPVDAPTEVQ